MVSLVSDTLSSQYDSGSSQFQQPSAVRQENRGKFVATETFGRQETKEVQDKIKSIKAAFDACFAELQAIQEAIWWRTCSSKDLKKHAATLTDLQRPIAEKAEKLYGFIGLQRAIPYLADIEAIPKIFADAKKLEVELLFAQKQIKRLKSYCECKTIRRLYDDHKACTAAFVEIVSGSCEQKIALAKGQIAKVLTYEYALPNEKRKVRAIKQLYLEMCELSLIAAEKLSKVGDGSLLAEIRDLTERIGTIRVELNPIVKKRPPISADVQIPQVDVTWLDGWPSKSYSFLAKASTTAWACYAVPRMQWYKETGDFGMKIERDVGQRMYRLLALLHERLIECCRGNLDPSDGMRTMQEEISRYTSSYYRLKNIAMQRRNELQTKPFDAFTQTLLDYMHGLDEAFELARTSLLLLDRCIKSPSLEVLKAISAHARYYSAVSDVQGLELALRLFPLAKSMQQKLQSPQAEPATPFDGLLERSVDLLCQVHATKDPELLRLTAEEAQVPDVILSRSDKMHWPVVLSFVVKRMQQFLFLPSEVHDVELELVLHVLRTDVRYTSYYQQSLVVQHTFKTVVDAYEATYFSRRIDLKEPCEIVRLILSTTSVQGYAEAVQRVLEYARTVPQEVFEAVGTLLQRKIKVKSEQFGYPFLHRATFDPDIETWSYDDPVAFERQLKAASEKIRPISVLDSKLETIGCALVFRVLCGALYANKVHEQVVLQQGLTTILASMDKLAFALPAPLQQLITDNALKKCSLMGHIAPLSYREHALLEQGPFEEYFAGRLTPEEHSKIAHVLFTLIEAEANTSEHDSPIADNFKQRLNLTEFEFNRWRDGYKMLCIYMHQFTME